MQTKRVRTQHTGDAIRVSINDGNVQLRIGEVSRGTTRYAMLSTAQALKVARHLLTAVDETLQQRQ